MHPRLFGYGLLFTAVKACLLPHERDSSLPGFSILRRQSEAEIEQYATEEYFALIRNSSAPVASNTADRFDGGRVAPRGLGSQESDATITTVMNIVEVGSAVKGLAEEFGIQLFDAPEKTHDGATMFGAKVGNKTCDEAYRILITAGAHPRERGGPDSLIYFISDLLWASREGLGLAYGESTYTNSQVNEVLAAGIVFMPLLNPDGFVFDQNTNLCWRKNRNPDGFVDLNRNYDFLWNFTKHFAPGVQAASTDPDNEGYYGTGPFSEPETRNVRWAYDTFTEVGWSMDVHSFADAVLSPWGDDMNQGTDPEQNFTNPEYDGKRGEVLGVEGEFEYRSYIETKDWDDLSVAAQSMAKGMQGANGGREVLAIQVAELYPTSGSVADYAFSRSYVIPNLTKVRGFGVEVGRPNAAMGLVSCPFYPNETALNENIRSVGAGLMEFILSAIDLGIGEPAVCDEKSEADEESQTSSGTRIAASAWAVLFTAAWLSWQML